MQRHIAHRRVAHARRGSFVLLAAVALLVVGVVIALVLDRLWIDAAKADLQSAAEVAALAAAGDLASDALLLAEPDHQALVNQVRLKAAEFANKNAWSTGPVVLDTSATGDVRLGRIVLDPDTNQEQLIETDAFPTSVVVFAHRSRNNGNPVGLFFGELTGIGSADLHAQSEASVDNRVLGLRPFDGAPVPAMPLAILDNDLDQRRTDTWTRQIDQRLGADLFSFDHSTKQVVQEPDGIPEIVLVGCRNNPDPDDVTKANVNWIDVGNGLHADLLASQTKTGWTAQDLTDFGGEWRFDESQVLDSDACLDNDALDQLAANIGQTHICLLYAGHQSTSRHGLGRLRTTRVVGVRVLDVTVSAQGVAQVTVQPAVITTRTALLSSTSDAWSTVAEDNQTHPYIYKIHRTH